MKCQFLLVLIFSIPFFSLMAQQGMIVPQNIRATNFAERLNYQLTAGSTSLLGIPMRGAEIIGDSYLFPEWRISTVMLYEEEKLLENYLIRYDMMDDKLEFKFPTDIRVLNANRVRSFVTIDSISREQTYFVNGRDYSTLDNLPYQGFLQVISDGKKPLVKGYDIIIKKPDYNMALMVGSIDYKIIKNPKYYYVVNSKVYPLPSSRKKILDVLNDKRVEMERFIKVNQLQLSMEHHLYAIFEYYNRISNL